MKKKRIRKGADGYDPLYRIRSISDIFNKRFDAVPKTERLCIDEQMCSTKMKHHLRQYMPNKPHKWGIKLFLLCDTYGYSYKFEIYIGDGDNIVLKGVPDLGATANIVADQEYKKANSGYAVEFVGRAYGIDITTVLWKDNRAVRLASTYVGIMPFLRNNPSTYPNKVARYDRKQKQYVEVECPQIIKEYNSHMGGVDMMDGLMGRYHIRLKTRNPMTRLFYHMIDMAVVNAFILYHRVNPSRNIKLPEFRKKIACELCNFSRSKKVGRPSKSAYEPVPSTGKKTVRPPDDIKFDNIGHIPGMFDKSGKKDASIAKARTLKSTAQNAI